MAARLPDFLIVGAAKAGTTTLYEILRQHRQIYLPVSKEPAFFCDDEYYNHGVPWYLKTHFADAGDLAVRGEATSTYLFWSGKVVPRLVAAYGDALPRIIAIFRDPVSLTHSFYWHSVREAREDLPFRDALAAEDDRVTAHAEFLERRGRIVYSYRQVAAYATHLGPYLERLPRERCLFLLTSDLEHFERLLLTLERFLGLDHDGSVHPVVSNAAALPRVPAVHRWLRQRSAIKDAAKWFLPFPVRHRLKMRAIDANLKPFDIPVLEADLAADLRGHYAGEMRRLESLIGRDLSAWYAAP